MGEFDHAAWLRHVAAICRNPCHRPGCGLDLAIHSDGPNMDACDLSGCPSYEGPAPQPLAPDGWPLSAGPGRPAYLSPAAAVQGRLIP